MRKRLPRLFAMPVAAVCLLGIVNATPPMAPTANADTLPNGYTVTCVPNGQDAICNVSGCPRVHEDEAGDVIHLGKVNANDGQSELDKPCNSTTTFRLYGPMTAPVTIPIQGCRKKFGPVPDECGPWSPYTYTPPAQAAAPAAPPAANQKPVKCTGGGQEYPPGSSCCPKGSASPVVSAGQQCQAAPPVNCPAGSVSATVPAGQQCAAPTNAVAMKITQNGFNAHAAVTNNSSLPAKCTYTATKTGGLGPQTVDKSIDVGPNSTNTITDMLWPPPLTSYNAVVNCMVTYNGKQTSIGQSSQPVSG
jgi:hypothetical protein